MTFSTEPRVRDESWFTWNADLQTSTIETYQLQAYNIILWVVSWKYNITDLLAADPLSQAWLYLARVEELMASWYLLIKEYWSDWTERKETWELKLKQANELLEKLFATPPTKLIWLTWVEITTVPISQAWVIESTWMIDRENTFTTQQVF